MPPRPRSTTRPYRTATGARASVGVADRASHAPHLAGFGARLRMHRVAAVLTQAELAERAALDVSYVSQMERGLRDPSLSSIEALAHALGMSLPEFFGDGALDPVASQARALAQELSALDEAARRDAVEILRRFHGAVARASAPKRRG